MPEKYMISDPASGQPLFIAAERANGIMGPLLAGQSEGETTAANCVHLLLSWYSAWSGFNGKPSGLLFFGGGIP